MGSSRLRCQWVTVLLIIMGALGVLLGLLGLVLNLLAGEVHDPLLHIQHSGLNSPQPLHHHGKNALCFRPCSPQRLGECRAGRVCHGLVTLTACPPGPATMLRGGARVQACKRAARATLQGRMDGAVVQKSLWTTRKGPLTRERLRGRARCSSTTHPPARAHPFVVASLQGCNRERDSPTPPGRLWDQLLVVLGSSWWQPAPPCF